jgi:hypothetical protein
VRSRYLPAATASAGVGGAPANLSAWPTRTRRAAARRPPRSPVPRRCRPRTPVRDRRRDARLFQQPRQIASFAPTRAGRRTVPARTGRSPAPIGECQMMTRAAKSALAAANYVTRRHRRPASIIRQQARRKTEPWPSQQAQITSDLCPQLKDAERPLAGRSAARRALSADLTITERISRRSAGRVIPFLRVLRARTLESRWGIWILPLVPSLDNIAYDAVDGIPAARRSRSRHLSRRCPRPAGGLGVTRAALNVAEVAGRAALVEAVRQAAVEAGDPLVARDGSLVLAELVMNVAGLSQMAASVVRSSASRMASSACSQFAMACW